MSSPELSSGADDASVGLPVVAIAGLGIESSTFSPARTDAAAFHPCREDDVLGRYAFLCDGAPLRAAASWRPTMVGKALPGGIVTADAFAELAGETIERLAALDAMDGLYLDIHGAMTVEGLEDAEGVLLERIRAVIGPDVLVSTSMDLHGNVSPRLARATDLITCYRMAPHEDAGETRERAVRNLLDRLRRPAPDRRPAKAYVRIPVLLPGERTSTRIEPARSVYAAVSGVEARPGVLDAAVWVGYAWADEPRNHAVVVVTGDDRATVAAGAEELARSFWAARNDFAFVAPAADLETCLRAALAPDAARPFVISDSGDNPTAGGAGDVTWTLARLLESAELAASGRRVVYASIPDREAAESVAAAGVGAEVSVLAGARVDDRTEPPVRLAGTVRSVRTGDPHASIEAVVRTANVDVILTARRKPYHYEHDFTDLGLDPRSADVLVVKIGYLEPELFDLAADWMLALTPGGVDQDLLRLGHHRIVRPMIPFDPDMPEPDLTARFVPSWSADG